MKNALQEIVVQGKHISICAECWHEPCICKARDWQDIKEDEEDDDEDENDEEG